MWSEPWTSRYMTMLLMYPKLGKMLILGATFNCLDPVLTIVTGLSVRDPFLTPMDKKDHNEKSSSAGLIGNDNTTSVLKSHIPYSIQKDPRDRLLALDLLSHPFIKKFEDKDIDLGILLAETTKAQFSCDYSDHLALVWAYEV